MVFSHVQQREYEIIHRLKHRMRLGASRIADYLGRGRSTIVRALRKKGKRSASVKTSARVRKRRKVVWNLLHCTKSRGDRTFPAFPTSKLVQKELAAVHGIVVSHQTVRRDAKALQLANYVRPAVPTRTTGDLMKKRAFAQRMLKEKRAKKFQDCDLVVSDETWANTNERTGRTMYALKKLSVLPREAKARYNIPSCMVWYACGVDWKSEIVILPAKMDKDGETRAFRLSAPQYIRRCLSKIKKHFEANPRLVLLQDGARAHVAKSVRAYLQKNKIRWLEDWPPYSPELNPCEYVHNELKNRVGMKFPRTLDELKVAIKEAWDELPQETIAAHVKNFSAKLLRVL